MKALALLGLGAATLAIAVAVAVVILDRSGDGQAAYLGSRPPEGIALPTFTLTDEGGTIVRSDDLRGKVVLVTFLDAQCADACPIVAGELARGVDALTEEERERVIALGISTDPLEDTQAAVDVFLARHRATGRVLYLTAPRSVMEPVWDAFKILPTARTGDDSLHSVPVQVYDAHGIWRSSLNAGVDLDRRTLLHDVRVALAE